MIRGGTRVAGWLSTRRLGESRAWTLDPGELELRQLFALNVLLQLVDGLLTYRAVQVGMLEGNPLISASMATMGTGSALLLYKAKACGLLFLLHRLVRPTLGGRFLLAMAVAMIMLAVVPWVGKLLAFAAV